MAQPIPQEVRDAIESGAELARTNPEVADLVEAFRPAIVDHLKQAHDCLGLVIKNWETTHCEESPVVIHGYFLQFIENMKAFEELQESLVVLATSGKNS